MPSEPSRTDALDEDGLDEDGTDGDEIDEEVSATVVAAGDSPSAGWSPLGWLL